MPETSPSFRQHRRPHYWDHLHGYQGLRLDIQSSLFRQVIPIILAVIIFILLSAALSDFLNLANTLDLWETVAVELKLAGVVVGATIYLKTAVDFAIFIGRLMHHYPGWLNRIAIETGTALGNALGTLLVMVLWLTFKEIEILAAIMFFLAALVLFELAYAGLEQLANWQGETGFKGFFYQTLDRPLETIAKIQTPILSRILPDLGAKFKGTKIISWSGLVWFSFTVPFILGMDDFSGYLPLFSLVDLYSFGVGVFFAHMILNVFLFLSPRTTVSVVRNEYVSFFGVLAFAALALFALFEAIQVLFL